MSGEQPDFYFTVGGLKTGPGIPITGPNDLQDAVFEDTPHTLPATGSYVIDLPADTMSEGPFGRFQITLTVK